MKSRLVLVAAIFAIAGGQGARQLALSLRTQAEIDEPYAPSPRSAAFVSLGYRELAADLLFFRLVGYFGGNDRTAPGVAALAEAIAALDPQYQKIYLWGARAIVSTRRGLDNATAERAIRLLEQGAARFPADYKIPKLAGEICLFNIATSDPAERRRWNERAAQFIETAVRKPSAPASAATLAAHLRTKLGQQQLAIESLREMILITDDSSARRQLLAKLAELEQADAEEIASELLLARRQFELAWRRDRPAVPASMYVLLGPPLTEGFSLEELATGGRDLVGFADLEPTP